MNNNCCLYNSIEKKICFICDNEYMYFLDKCNVVGVGLGYKIKCGFNTFKKCITVFVNKKVDNNYLNKNDLIPKSYKGIQTDVVESGEFFIKSLTDRVRPAEGGYNIGPIRSAFSGTMGCLVKDEHNDLHVLSNNHVLAAENYLPIGREIVQPGNKYHIEPNNDVIATLSKYIKLKPKNFLYYPTNYADCAIGKVINPDLVSSKIALIGNVKGIIEPQLDQPIKKVGSTTDLTTGKVTNVNVTIYSTYFIGRCLFKKQIMCDCMALSGDSGALVLDENNYAIGLLMAGNKDRSGVNPIKYILDSLKVSIVTG